MTQENTHVIFDAENGQVLLVNADSADAAEERVASQDCVTDKSRVYWEGLLEDKKRDLERDGITVMNE